MMARIDTRLPRGFLILSSALLILSSTFATPISTGSVGEPSLDIDGSSSKSNSGNLTSSTLSGIEEMTSVSKSNQALDTRPSESKNISEVSGPPSPSLTDSVVNSASVESPSPSSPVGDDQIISPLTKVETLVEKIEEKAKWSLEPLKNAFHAFECSLGFCDPQTSSPAQTPEDSTKSPLPSSPQVETNNDMTSAPTPTSSAPTAASTAASTPIPSTTATPTTTSSPSKAPK